MRKLFVILIIVAMASGAIAQTQQPSSPRPTQQSPAFDVFDYGVSIQPDNRLIIVMAALEAAGWDPTPPGREPSAFRKQLRGDLSSLDSDLRARMQRFYEQTKLKATGSNTLSPAQQASPYVSLAYVIGQPPGLDEPQRSDDLPAQLLDVFDFSKLLREFYRRSGIVDKLPVYFKAYQVQGDRIRQGTAEMVRQTLTFLHTQPTLMTIERIPIPNSSTDPKKKQPQRYSMRERERRFYVVPDLLAAPGAINFRIIGDDYFAVVSPDINPASSELRRAYLQFVIDPLILRNNKEIAARRDQLKQLLNERTKAGTDVSPDVFLAVNRSLVAAADARLDETVRVERLMRESRARLDSAKDAATRQQILKEAETQKANFADETVAQIAGAYENGAVLAFYFADKLRDIEASGFDVASLLADMIASFDPVRELKRLDENKVARGRAVAARKARREQIAAAESAEATSPRAGALVKGLLEVDELSKLKQYETAEQRLQVLLREYPGEPRVFFALGEIVSQSVSGVFDEDLQKKRLEFALLNYGSAINNANAETDRGLVARAHLARGRILEFFDRGGEAGKEYEAAIQIGPVTGDAYKEALARKAKLAPPR